MEIKRLWLLVEGDDDRRFFERLKYLFEERYDFVQMWRYAVESRKRIKNFLKSIEAMKSDYFFVKDLNAAPCVTARIESVINEFGQTVDRDNLIIVVREIESWYLAGIGGKSCEELGLRPFDNTNDVTKEHFNNLIPNKFDSRIDFMVEVLKRFSLETAKQKNKSFGYFMTKI